MDVSRTQIYDIKNEKIPVSRKMFAKLEQAERAAGLGQVQEQGGGVQVQGQGLAGLDPGEAAMIKYAQINDRIHQGEEVSPEEVRYSAEVGPLINRFLQELQTMNDRLARIEKKLGS